MTQTEKKEIAKILEPHKDLYNAFSSMYESDICINNTIYICCMIRKVAGTDETHFIPIIFFSENQKTCKLMSSDNLINLQLENQDLLNNMYRVNFPVVILPLPISTYSDLLNQVQDSITVLANTYKEAYETYLETLDIIGGAPTENNFHEEFLNTLITESSLPVVLNSKLELVPAEEYNLPYDDYREEDYDEYYDEDEDEDYDDYDF